MKKIQLLTCFFILINSVSAQKDSSLIVFQHANVIDGISNKPLLNVTVSVEKGKIVGIQKDLVKIAASAIIIDLNGKWLLPGYVDAHVHFSNFEAAKMALASGVTTARTMGSEHFVDVQIRDAHRQGQSDLPDIIASGYQIRPDMSPAFFQDFPELAALQPKLSGIENVRSVVKALISRGVDHIKILATERGGTPETDPRKRTFTDEEIVAIVDEARKAGLYVAAHAHGDEGAYAAVKAGVRSIEHGTYLSDKTLALMKLKKTYLVPTFTASDQPPADPKLKDNPILAERNRIFKPLRTKMTNRAYKMHIRIIAGTDVRYSIPGLTMATEAIYLQKAGLLPMEVIQSMTYRSAQCLGIDGRTGAIKKGLEADMVILGKNPLESLENLKGIIMVINDGKIAINQLH